VVNLLGDRFVMELQHTYSHMDYLELALAKEAQNGRIARLLMKLGFINERPEYNKNSSWSETGDRYLLKLFRDYVFHQQRDDGSPNVSLHHVVDCLNKLDAGVPERVCLKGQGDRDTLLVIRYSDLKRCMNEAFTELSQPHNSSPLTSFPSSSFPSTSTVVSHLPPSPLSLSSPISSTYSSQTFSSRSMLTRNSLNSYDLGLVSTGGPMADMSRSGFIRDLI